MLNSRVIVNCEHSDMTMVCSGDWVWFPTNPPWIFCEQTWSQVTKAIKLKILYFVSVCLWCPIPHQPTLLLFFGCCWTAVVAVVVVYFCDQTFSQVTKAMITPLSFIFKYLSNSKSVHHRLLVHLRFNSTHFHWEYTSTARFPNATQVFSQLPKCLDEAILHGNPGGGRGTPPYLLYGDVPLDRVQCMVFRDSCLKQGIQFTCLCLEQGIYSLDFPPNPLE